MLGWVGVAQRCLKIVDSRLHTRNAHFQPRKKSRKWGKIKNPLGSGDTGRQRNVQLYIQATACDRRLVFATNKKEIYTHTLVETWRVVSAISKVWNAYEWNTKMTNWLGGGRASYNESFPGRRKETEQSGKRRIWGVDFKSLVLVSFKKKKKGDDECLYSYTLGHGKLCYLLFTLGRKLLLFVDTLKPPWKSKLKRKKGKRYISPPLFVHSIRFALFAFSL